MDVSAPVLPPAERAGTSLLDELGTLVQRAIAAGELELAGRLIAAVTGVPVPAAGPPAPAAALDEVAVARARRGTK